MDAGLYCLLGLSAFIQLHQSVHALRLQHLQALLAYCFGMLVGQCWWWELTLLLMPELLTPWDASWASLFQSSRNDREAFGSVLRILLQALGADLLQHLWQGTPADPLNCLCVAVHVASHRLHLAVAVRDLWGSICWRETIGLNLLIALHWLALQLHAVERLCRPKVRQQGPSTEAFNHTLSLAVVIFTPQDIYGLEVAVNEATSI